MDDGGQTLAQAVAAICGIGGGGGLIFKVNNKAQKALDKTEAMDKRLERIETGIDSLTTHLLNK